MEGGHSAESDSISLISKHFEDILRKSPSHKAICLYVSWAKNPVSVRMTLLPPWIFSFALILNVLS